MISSLVVNAGSDEPASEPAVDLTVRLKDFTFALPESLPACLPQQRNGSQLADFSTTRAAGRILQLLADETKLKFTSDQRGQVNRQAALWRNRRSNCLKIRMSWDCLQAGRALFTPGYLQEQGALFGRNIKMLCQEAGDLARRPALV